MEFEHFLPIVKKIVFKHGETEATASVGLIPKKEDESAEEVNDVIFKVELYDA